MAKWQLHVAGENQIDVVWGLFTAFAYVANLLLLFRIIAELGQYTDSLRRQIIHYHVIACVD